MKKRVRFGFFGYLTVDYRAVQSYLDAMAAEGWALAEVWLGLVARFRRTDRTDLRYWVDIAEPVPEDAPEYRAHVREAGWERLYTVRYMNIYRSLPGADPQPLRPQDGETMERYRSNALRWANTCAATAAALALLAFARLLLMWYLPTGSLLWLSAASGAVSYLQVVVPAVWVFGGVYVGVSLRRAAQWRAAARTGMPPPEPGRRAARAGGALTALTYLGVAVLILFATLDLASAPTPRPLIMLALLTVVLFLITVCSNRSHLRQPKRVRLWRCAVLAGLIVAVGLVRGACTPVLAELHAGLTEQLPGLPGEYGTVESGGSFLLGYARGIETANPDSGTKGQLVAEYYDCASGVMTARMAADLGRWSMEPVAGLDQVWASLGEHAWRLLSVRGNQVRLVSIPRTGRFQPMGRDADNAVTWVTGGARIYPADETSPAGTD